MKSFVIFLMLLSAVSTSQVMAQQPYVVGGGTVDPTEWKQKDTYHNVLATTFHPAEDGDFEPLLTRCGELLSAATAWKKSKMPPGLKYTGNVKRDLTALEKSCKTVCTAIKQKKPNEELFVLITKTHDIFHDIINKISDR